MRDMGWDSLEADVREAATGEPAPPSEDEARTAAKILIKANEVMQRMKRDATFASAVRPFLRAMKSAADAAVRSAGTDRGDDEDE